MSRQYYWGSSEEEVQGVFRWYVINTYSGHENKVKTNLEHRIVSMGQQPRFRRVVVPTESVIETKDGQKVQAEKRVLPGYVLVNMNLDDEAWALVKNTPGVTGFVGSGSKPVPLSEGEIERILHTGKGQGEGARPRAQVEFSLGESVKITSGHLADFDGEIVDVNPDQQKLKVLVNIFERQVPVELSFEMVKKLD
ncbi:MAG: transcription termination/antitermination protein NusG [Gaiellaceae bacterium]